MTAADYNLRTPKGTDLISHGDNAITHNAERTATLFEQLRYPRSPLGASSSIDSLATGVHFRVGSIATAQGWPVSRSTGSAVVEVPHDDGSNGHQSVTITDAEGTVSYARRRVNGDWSEWAREKRPVQPLAVGDDVGALRLEAHDGTYRVANSAIAEGVAGLPLARAGVLDVRWIRGVNASTSVSVQTYITDRGEEFTRYSGTSWSPWLGGSGAAGDVSQVDMVLAIGQSNMSGRGTPSGAGLDFGNPLVWQYGSKVRTLRPAGVPLDMHDSATGLSPATVFAEEWVREAGPSTVCLLIPAAHGGTGFHTSPWNWGDASGAESLLEAALDQAAEGVAAARVKWPGAAVTMRAVLWHQGENTGGATEAEHTADLDTLISRIRAVYAGVPVILGELSPDTTAGVAGSSSGMTHQKTPGRVERAALAHTPPNASREGDLLHLGRWGVETLGRRMFEQYPAAVANRAGEVVMPPPAVRTSTTGIEWDAPLCRATGYTVQHSPDGESWSSAGVTVLGRRATLPAAASWARVATVGPSGASRYTHPVSAQVGADMGALSYDSGLRNVSDLARPFTTSITGITLQRVGREVEFVWCVRRFDSAPVETSPTTILTLPPGMRPRTTYRVSAEQPSAVVLDVSASGAVQVRAGSIPLNSYVTFRLKHSTSEPPPITPPGGAA